MDMSKYVKMYVSESQDRLQRMDGLLLALEQDGSDRGAIDTLFREAHSIKGMSASMGYEELSRVSHRMEDFLEQFRGGKGTLERRSVDTLFEGVDLLRRAVEEIAAGGAPTAEQVQAGQFSGGLSLLVATTRSAAEVQAFLASLPDVASVVVRPAETDVDGAPSPPPPPRSAKMPEPTPPEAPELPQPEAPRPTAASAPAAPSPSPPGPPPPPRRAVTMMRVDTRLLDDLMDQVGELVTANGALLEVSQVIDSARLHESTGRLEGLVKGLQQHAMKLRMMPLELIADRFPRAVRDLAKKRGKEISFEVLGKDTEMDRAILEELPDPILHILRNAIDHGIEPAEERVRKGKPPVGTIRLEATKERESVVIRVTDDGRGIDPAVLRRVALDRGVINREQADTLLDAEVMMLITLPGFSTAKEVTDVSGRGVGMDVVRGAVESLRGNLLIDSVVNQGTVFTLKLPLTLVVVAVLLIAVGDERYALPVSTVEQILEIRAEEIQHAQGQEMITREGALLPLVHLRQFLGMPATEAAPSCLVVVCEMRSRLVGLAVDRLIGYREVVVKPLDKALKSLRGFSGVTILGDGGALLLLDLNTL